MGSSVSNNFNHLDYTVSDSPVWSISYAFFCFSKANAGFFSGAYCYFPEGFSATFPPFSLMSILNKLNWPTWYLSNLTQQFRVLLCQAIVTWLFLTNYQHTAWISQTIFCERKKRHRLGLSLLPYYSTAKGKERLDASFGRTSLLCLIVWNPFIGADSRV